MDVMARSRFHCLNWSTDDKAIALVLAREGKSNKQIGETLGRTVDAVKENLSRMRACGIDIPYRRRGPPEGYGAGVKRDGACRHTVPFEKRMTRAEADVLAQRVTRHWHARGHTHVRVWVEEAVHHKGGTSYEIKSNLVRGMPPARPVGAPQLAQAAE